MLSPFTPELKAVFDDHIRPVAESLGMSAARADDFFSAGSVVQAIWSALHYAEVIVADCTDRNANVFYEIGIAHALGRETILVTQRMEDIPFDLRHLRVIVYNPSAHGMSEFRETLAHAIGVHLKRKLRIPRIPKDTKVDPPDLDSAS